MLSFPSVLGLQPISITVVASARPAYCDARQPRSMIEDQGNAVDVVHVQCLRALTERTTSAEDVAMVFCMPRN